MFDFNIDNDYKNYIFKCLCKQRAIVIFHAESNKAVAIITGKSYNSIMDACSKSQNDYILRFLSELPTYIKYPFLYDAVTCIAYNKIRDRLKEAIKGWAT